jgi:hypothetical protein
MITNRILHTAATQDYNDMRSMITQLEQKLLGVDPRRQAKFYAALQNRLYEMLMLDSDEDNIILYPHNSGFTPLGNN